MNSRTKVVRDMIKIQFQEMLTRGIVPVFEFKLSTGEYFTADLSVHDKGVCFEFDEDGLPVSFDGEIKGDGDTYYLPYDEYFDHLDYYLNMISENILEGYLLPNDLYTGEE